VTCHNVYSVFVGFITPADGSRGGRVLPPFVCLSPYDISTTDPTRIIELDTQMLHDESPKLIYFGVKRSVVKVTTQKQYQYGSLHSCECWLLPVK